MKTEISIVIPFYNSEKTLARAVNSILSQDYPDWELILVNDGSMDSSEEVAQSFLSDSRITYFSQENKGVSVARNFGASQAESYYLVFLDADDLITERHLADFKAGSLDLPDLVTCEMKIFLSGKESKLAQNGSESPTIPGSWIIKKEVFLELGGYDERLKFSENTEFFIRFNKRKRYQKHIKKANLLYFQSESGGSKNLQNMIDSILIILEKHDSVLTNHVKYLYHQIVGVNQLRFRRFEQARKHLRKAYFLKPFQLKTFVRLILSYLPIISKQIYKPL